MSLFSLPFTVLWNFISTYNNKFAINIIKLFLSYVFTLIFEQGFWGRGQSASGCGGVCQAWTATTFQRASREGRWVLMLAATCGFFSPHLDIFHFFLPTHPFVFLLSGEFVAQFKFTVLLMANGSHRITSGPLDPELYKSEHEVQDPKLKVDAVNSLDLHESHFTTQKIGCIQCYFHHSLKLFQTLLQSSASRKTQKKKKKKVNYSLCIPQILTLLSGHLLLCFLSEGIHLWFTVSSIFKKNSPLFSHFKGFKDSRKRHWTAHWGHGSCRITSTAFPHMQDPKEKEEKT